MNLNPDTFGVVVGSNQLFNINQEDEGADGVDVTAKDVSLLVDSLVGGEDYAYTTNCIVRLLRPQDSKAVAYGASTWIWWTLKTAMPG